MTLALAAAAAVGCSLCNGISTIQQKVGADTEKNQSRIDLTILLRLFNNLPYISGIVLELIGYALSLAALQLLPLFLVQSVIAASVVVTAIAEKLILHRKLSRKTLSSISITLVGLVIIAVGARSSTAVYTAPWVITLLEWFPLVILVLSAPFIYIRGKNASYILAAFAGIAFGNTSTIGRILPFSHGYLSLVQNPLLWSLIASAIIGQYLFTLALQRTSATKSNAAMIVMQTLIPASFGLAFFNDHVRSDFMIPILIGSLLVIIGCVGTAIMESPFATI